MSEPRVQVVIPFRDRGIDLRRGANLEVVQGWWYAHGMEAKIVSDGLKGDAQFNRHRAYNLAVSGNPDVDIFVFTEADMLIHPNQIRTAVRLAVRKPVLVVPFTEYRYLSDKMTGYVRDRYFDLSTEELAEWWGRVHYDPLSLFHLPAESIRRNGKSIGAVNVISHQALDITGGFTEATSGNWYDDNIIEEGFAFLTGNKTQHVGGPAVHLYHLPGWKGEHLTEEDRAATDKNRAILETMRTYIRMREHQAVKDLMEARA